MLANTDRHCQRNHQELTPERALSLLLYLIYVLEEFLGISISLDSSNRNSLDGPTNRQSQFLLCIYTRSVDCNYFYAFLSILYPMVFSCAIYQNSVGFPTERKNQPHNFVGASVVWPRLWNICPEKCRRKGHVSDWQHC